LSRQGTEHQDEIGGSTNAVFDVGRNIQLNGTIGLLRCSNLTFPQNEWGNIMPVLKVFIIGELKAALKELDTVFKYLKLDDRELADYDDMLQVECKRMEEGKKSVSVIIAPSEIRLAKRILNHRCSKDETNIPILRELFKSLSGRQGFTTTMEDICIAYEWAEGDAEMDDN
jgi:hypothetical protein